MTNTFIPLASRLRRTGCALLAATVCVGATVGGAAAQSTDRMVWTNGNGLSTTTGTQFSQLVVLLTSVGSGAPVANAPVTFTIAQGTASFPNAAQSAQVMTDSGGYASTP